MKRIAIAAALTIATLSGVACATIPAAPPDLTQTTADEKALFVAEAAYFGTASAAEAAVDNGLLKGDAAAKVNEYQKRAYDALLAARAAYLLGDATTYQQKLAAVQVLAGQAWALIPGKREK